MRRGCFKLLLIMGGALCAFALLIVWAASSLPHENSAPTTGAAATTPTPELVTRGQTGVLDTGNHDARVLVAATSQALDDFYTAAVNKDRIGGQQMFDDGRVYWVDANTPCLVIGNGFLTSEVRILAGPHYGAAVWVDDASVKPMPTPTP